MRQRLILTFLLLALLPCVAKAQWTFDIVSVEAYINDHKKQRSLLLARSTLEYSNKLLHEYSRDATEEYKELNVDLDRYTRAFDVIDVMYQSLRTVLNAKDTYTTVSDRIGDYKEMLTEFNDKVLKRGKAEPEDLLILTINKKAEAINGSLDDIERHLNRAYMETWRYIQVRIGYWKEKIYQARSRQEIIDGAFGRWRCAGKLDY